MGSSNTIAHIVFAWLFAAASPSPAISEDIAIIDTAAGGCVKDVGCGDLPKPFPKCDAETVAAAKPLQDVLNDRNLLSGKVVTVLGPLVGSVGCTEKGCGDSACCNRCDGGLILGRYTSGQGYSTLSLLDPDPTRFQCSGDDTGFCCVLPWDGQDAIVVGTLRSASGGGNWALDGITEVCAP